MSQTQHVFIIGSKSIGQYGGYETFVDKLTEQHAGDSALQYHVACKANGEGCMDEARLQGVRVTGKNKDGEVTEFIYHGARAFKIKVPNIGPAVAIYYDVAAVRACLRYCRAHQIPHPIFYILTCRIGPFIAGLKRQIAALGGALYLNPDGHEWMRSKWSPAVRRYWKYSEKAMVRQADCVVCDSRNIEKYIQREYAAMQPRTCFIAYGADLDVATAEGTDEKYARWLSEHDLEAGEYYLVVGRFVPENNFATMIREYMASRTTRPLALVTNLNGKFSDELEQQLSFSKDGRIRFVGTVYDAALLRRIRENARGYLHGHEVGGTNPSLLEALSCTRVNLLLDVGFNREVGLDAALYWTKEPGSLAALIQRADELSDDECEAMGQQARDRIRQAYSWPYIAGQYRELWLEQENAVR